MITGAFLAETAEAVDNKLNVTGGVIENYTVGPDREVRVILVLLTQTQTGETPGDFELNIRPPALSDPNPFTVRGPLPKEAARGESGFAPVQIEITLPFDGRWVFEASAGGNTVAVPLNVRSAG
jgi:hypothetical protein